MHRGLFAFTLIAVMIGFTFPRLAASQSASPQVLARMNANHLALSHGKVRCILESVAQTNEKPATLKALVKHLAQGRKLELVLKDFRTNVQPGVLYTIYLDLPEDASAKTAKEHAVGNINFFNATIAPNPARAPKSERFISFDITRLVNRLAANGTLQDKPTLTIVPAGEPVAEAKPLIGTITLVEQ